MAKISQKISKFTEKEASQLFRKAKRVFRHPCLDFLCAPSDKNFGRILVVTSKSIGKANKRNLVRRRIKSIFYEEKLFENRLDCIAIIKKDGINLPFAELKKLITHVYSKIKKSCK